jgi:hypothetical protein
MSQSDQPEKWQGTKEQLIALQEALERSPLPEAHVALHALQLLDRYRNNLTTIAYGWGDPRVLAAMTLDWPPPNHPDGWARLRPVAVVEGNIVYMDDEQDKQQAKEDT